MTVKIDSRLFFGANACIAVRTGDRQGGADLFEVELASAWQGLLLGNDSNAVITIPTVFQWCVLRENASILRHSTINR